MAEGPSAPWTLERFLDEEFGPPMLLRAAGAIREAQQITEALGSPEDNSRGRARLRALIDQVAETAQLHHWKEEDDVLAALAALPLRDGTGADLVRQVRAGLHELESRVLARLITTVKQNRRREGRP